MAALYDRVGMTTATTGTGPLTLGSAIIDPTNGDYLTFADAGVPNATVVSYLIVNGNNFELGTGTYTSAGTTLSRTAYLSKTAGTKGTTAITLVGSSNVYIVPHANSAGETWNFPGGFTLGTVSGDITISPGGGNITTPRSNRTKWTGSGSQGGNIHGIPSLGNGLCLERGDATTVAQFTDTGSAVAASLGITTLGGGIDTAIGRNAAGVVEVTNGTAGVSATLKTGGLRVGYIVKAAAYTAVIPDEFISCDATSGVFTITLPTAVGCTGQIYTIKKVDSSANAVTVATTSSQTIDGSTTYSLSAQWNAVTVVSNGANWLIQSKV